MSAIGPIIGDDDDDKYDEVGEVINTLSRDAGKNFRIGKYKYQTGDVAGGTAHMIIGCTEVQVAILLMIAFP